MNINGNGMEPNRNGRGSDHHENGNGRSLTRRLQPLAAIRRQQAPEVTALPFNMADQNDRRRFSMGDYIGLLWRGKWIILACMTIAGLIAAYLTFRLPFVYQSSLQVFINDQDSRAGIFDTRAADPWQDPDRKLKKELQILNSISIRQVTADSLYSRRFLDTITKDSIIPVVAAMEAQNSARLKDVSPEERRKIIVDDVAATIGYMASFTPSKETDIIKIATRAGDPYEAAIVANFYAKAYVKQNELLLRENARKVKEFAYTQMLNIRDSLSRQESKLLAYQKGNKTLVTADMATDLAGSTTIIQRERDAAGIEIQQLRMTIQEGRKQLKAVESRIVRNVTSTFPQYIESMKSDLASLQRERDAIKAAGAQSRSPQYDAAKMKDYDDRIRRTEEKINLETEKWKRETGGTIGGGGLSTIEQANAIKKQIAENEILLAGLQAKVSGLSSSLGEAESRVALVPDQKLDLGRLVREITQLELLYKTLQETYNKKILEEESVFSSVRLMEEAKPNLGPVSPDRSRDIITGIVAGLALGVGIVLLIAFLDTTIHSPDDLEKNGHTMLTAIPEIRDDLVGSNRLDVTPTGKVSAHLVTQINPKSPVAEAYRSLRTGIQYASLEENSSVILFTSSTPQEGKSTTAVNTAIVFAQSGAKTLIIDCDLRRPTIHTVFSLPKEPGTVNALIGQVTLDEAISSTLIPNLDVLTSGSIPPNPSELLGSKRMRDMLEELRGRYDTIIIDSPPTGAVTDAVILSTLADLSIIVVRAHKTRLEFLEKTRSELERVFVSPLGVVLNDFDVSQSYGSAYKYYRYYKYYGYYGQAQETLTRKQRRAQAALKDFTEEKSE